MHWSASQARSSSRLALYHPSISSIGRLKLGQMRGSSQKKRVLMHQALPRAAQPAALWGTEAGAAAADQQRSHAGAAIAQGRPAAAPHGAAVNQRRAPPRGASGAVRPLRAGDAPGGRRGRPTGRGRPFWFSPPPGMPRIPLLLTMMPSSGRARLGVWQVLIIVIVPDGSFVSAYWQCSTLGSQF